MRKFLSALFLCISFITIAPNSARADDRRYYDDREHRDRHEWNEAEQRAWRHWVTEEHHRRYHEWTRANDRERREYWRWRHEHQDWH